MGLPNDAVDEHMDCLFGKERADGRPGGLSQGEAVLVRVLRTFGGVLPRAMTIRDHHALFEAAADLIEFIPPRLGAPTAAQPGSREKIELLRLRLLRGEVLFHPDDVTALDERDDAREFRPSNEDVCLICGGRIVSRRGRRRLWCGDRCRRVAIRQLAG